MKAFIICLMATFITFQSCQKEELVPDSSVDLEVSDKEFANQDFGDKRFIPGSRNITRPVIDPINGDAVVGSARLFRFRTGIGASIRTNNLIPGHTYTLWWVIYNNPENCVNSPCGGQDNSNQAVARELLFATGKAVRSGAGGFLRTFTFLPVGDDTGSINAELGLPEYGGLLNPETAEVHLVLRSHGPAIDGLVEEQITTFNGGCSISLPSFTEIPDEEGECANIQYAIFEGF